MNVEHIQKINELAQELFKQGLAQDREDAMIQAERAYHSRSDKFSEIRATLEGVKEEAKPKAEADLSQEQIKEILEKNSLFLVKKIKEFQEQMNALEQEISLLKNKLANAYRPAAAPPAAREPPKAEGHPRSGNYKNEDVSIEKFFYAGKK